MLKFEFATEKDRALKILCLGAHSDDIEIGCGGTILRFLEERNNAEIYWVVFAANAERAVEATKSANLFLKNTVHKNIIVKNFRDGFFPHLGIEIKEYFERLKTDFDPDLIFTHHRQDLHQDHRFISDVTWQTFRDHLILEYEIPKYDADLGSPGFFIHLNQSICRRKLDYILDVFVSQHGNQWFTEDTFWSTLRLRGLESNAPEKYAEGFYCRKMILK